MPKKKKMHTTYLGTYLGVDPGKNGGIALIRDQEDVNLFPMPTTERDIWFLFDNLLAPSRIKAIIERVHSMPNQGVSSTFTFGMGYGGLRMALTAARIPFEEVTSRTWQKGLGVSPRKKTESKSQFKNRLRAKAQQLFPDLDVWRSSKKEQLSVCDALLIAEYCRRKDQGKL